MKILTLDSTGQRRVLNLEKLLLVPTLEHNLFSIRAITEKGHQTIFKEDRGYIELEGRPLQVTFRRRGNLFTLTPLKEEGLTSVKRGESTPLKIWHSHMGHQASETLKLLCSSVTGLNLSNIDSQECAKMKMLK